MEENEENLEEKDQIQEIPLCPHCLTPFNPLQHYCENCGEAVGQYTPYIPYVNIRFNVSIFGHIWDRLWRNDISWPVKTFYIFLLVILYLGAWPFLGIAIIIGLVVKIVKKTSKHISDKSTNGDKPKIQK